MSTKVWALNRETGEVQHINHIDKSYKGKMICLDENCGEELIICMGEKNKPYFSHQKNTTCGGGSTETLLHMLGKQILSKCKSFTLPDEYVIFRQKKVLFSSKRTIMVKEVVPFEILDNKFKTGVKLVDFNGDAYYVEFATREVKSSRKTGYIKNECKAIAVDLHKFARDTDNIDEKELTEFICGALGVKTYITSPSIAAVESEINKSLFCASGDYIACPAYNFEEIVEKANCKDCPFFLYSQRSDGSIHCAGRGCYSEAVDFKNMDFYDYRRERYIDLVPKPVWGVDKYAHKKMLGVCSRCGGELRIAQGNRARQIKGVRMVDKETAYAYLVCEDCGSSTIIRCPDCKEPMELRVNRSTRVVFLGCSAYADRSCRASLSLFNGEPCRDNYADQLLQVGGLSLFLSDPKKARRKLFAAKDDKHK